MSSPVGSHVPEAEGDRSSRTLCWPQIPSPATLSQRHLRSQGSTPSHAFSFRSTALQPLVKMGTWEDSHQTSKVNIMLKSLFSAVVNLLLRNRALSLDRRQTPPPFLPAYGKKNVKNWCLTEWGFLSWPAPNLVNCPHGFRCPSFCCPRWGHTIFSKHSYAQHLVFSSSQLGMFTKHLANRWLTK